MDLDAPSWWVRLEIARIGSDLRIDARSDRQIEQPPTPAGDDRLDLFGYSVILPGRTVDMVAGLARAMPFYPRTGKPALLPVFVAPRAGMRHLPWESELLAVLVARTGAPNLALLRWVHSDGAFTPPAKLPLRVLAVGSTAYEGLASIGEGPWSAEDLGSHGLSIALTKSSRLEHALRTQRPSLVVANDPAVSDIVRWGFGSRRGGPRGLRLLIDIVDGQPRDRVDRAPDGTSILTVDRAYAAQVTNDVVTGLVQDIPLHVLVNQEQERFGASAGLSLIGNPASIQGLRLASMMQRTIERARGVRASLVREHGARETTLDEPSMEASPLDIALSSLPRPEALRLDVLHQTGFSQLAAASRAVDAAENAIKVAASEAPPRRPGDAEEPVGSRTVDMQLERTDYVPPNLMSISPHPWLETSISLRGGARYRLCIVIGVKLPGSLLAKTPPGIDGVLPPMTEPITRRLEVGVYGRGLLVRGRAIRPLSLPPAGPSNPVRFDLEAPTELGIAGARVVVYWRNQAVQSFWLSAKITQEEVSSPDRALGAKLEFSRSAEFTNLDRLSPRIANLAVNQDRRSNRATHTFTFKGSGAEACEAVLDGAMDEQMDGLRQYLYQLTFKPVAKAGGTPLPRFPVTSTTGRESQEFRSAFRELAHRGSELYYAVAKSVAAREQLKPIKRSAGKTIQITRYDTSYAFPWTILYDYPLPTLITGSPPPRDYLH